MGPNRNIPRILVIIVLVVLLITLLAGIAEAQDIVVVAEPLPNDIDTWSELVAYWLPKVLQGALASIGTVLAFSLKQLVGMAPAFVQAYIDSKRQKDFHSAIMSKVALLMKEGRWPTAQDLMSTGRELVDVLKPDLIEEIREYVNEYSPQAGRWAKVDQWTERAESLLRTLAVRKAAELTGDPLAHSLRESGVSGVQDYTRG